MSRVIVHPNDQWPTLAATQIISFLQDRLSASPEQIVTVALAGGTTPVPVYRQWSKLAPAGFDWNRVRLFLSDERMVPQEHSDSNFRVARESLPLAPHLHAVNTMRTAEDAAEDYESLIRDFVAAGNPVPQFDLILLGVGNDGHTASLFPGSPVLSEKRNLVSAAVHPESLQARVTFTLPLIQAASRVAFLVSGAAKSSILARLLSTPDSGLPAALAARVSRDVEWILDEDAHGGPGG